MKAQVLLVGSGALATLFAARLSAQGINVCLLGNWQAGISALQKEGARLLSADHKEHSYAVQATHDPQQCLGISYALVLVKAWQTERAARHLATCLPKDGVAITLQNGMGNRERLAEILGRERVVQGITTTGATLLGPGLVRAGGEGKITLEDHPKIAPLRHMLQQAKFNTEIVEEALPLVWGKAAINAAINPLTALLNIPNGELLTHPAARTLMGLLAKEAAAVAAAQGIRLPYDDPVAAAEDVARCTAANTSSMLQDVKRGAPTEIDAICGAIVGAGERFGCDTPVNRVFWHLVQARVSTGRHGKII